MATSAWGRWLMPSAADVVFVALLSALAFTPLSVRLLGDAGIGWHIRTGQQILATHSIPRTDPFSSVMQGKPWFAWEWLYDVLVGRLDAIAGLNGVVWFTAVVIGAVFAWTFRILIARGTRLPVAFILVLLATSASMIHFLARPHVVNWLFSLAWFWVLDVTELDAFAQRSRGRERWLWVLPVLMLFWVNLHGGFVLGFVLLGIFWVGSLWTYISTRNDRIEDALQKIGTGKRARHLFWVGLVSVAASFANPYGWKLHAHIYSYLSNRFLMNHIDEFQSPNFHLIAQKCFLVIILIAIAALAVRGRALSMSRMLTLLLTVWSGLYSSRNIPVSSILLVIIIGPLLPSLRIAPTFFQRMAALESGLRGHLWPIVAIVISGLIAANGGQVGSKQMMDAHFDPGRMPVAAVNYLDAHSVHGPFLSPDFWGGYLIYSLYPKAQVVVDDRHDLYGAEFFKSYLQMIHVERGWNADLIQYRPGCVLLPRNSALANILVKTTGWEVAYSDDVSIAFVRSMGR